LVITAIAPNSLPPPQQSRRIPDASDDRNPQKNDKRAAPGGLSGNHRGRSLAHRLEKKDRRGQFLSLNAPKKGFWRKKGKVEKMKNADLPIEQLILAAQQRLSEQREDFIAKGNIPADLAWRLYIDAGLVGALLFKTPMELAEEMRDCADRIERLEFKP
jgi:hypothetical protein